MTVVIQLCSSTLCMKAATHVMPLPRTLRRHAHSASVASVWLCGDHLRDVLEAARTAGVAEAELRITPVSS